jgi:apolipoprotein N-acyltransferase
MTRRQVAGAGVFCGLLLGLAFFYWLAPMLGYKAPHWVFYVCGPLMATGWGIYYHSNYAKH